MSSRSGTALVAFLGASAFPHATSLPPAAAFARSHEALTSYLLDPSGFGLSRENLLDLFDTEASSNEIDRQLAEWLRERVTFGRTTARPFTDLLVFYVGHGGFRDNSDDYYLAIRSTLGDNPYFHSIPLASLAKTLRQGARHLRRYIILDSCFAASAVETFMSPVEDVVRRKIEDVNWSEADAPATGTALLCSSSRHSPSRFLADGLTMFSGALHQVLRSGSAEYPSLLSMRDLQRLTWEAIRARHRDEGVRPELHSPDQRGGDIAGAPLFPNALPTQIAAAASPVPVGDQGASVPLGRVAEQTKPQNSDRNTGVPWRTLLKRRSTLGVGLAVSITFSAAAWMLGKPYGPSSRVVRTRGRDTTASLRLAEEEAARGGHRTVLANGDQVDVTIPPASKDGDQIRIPGRGEAGSHGGDHGDLVVTLDVAQKIPPEATAGFNVGHGYTPGAFEDYVSAIRFDSWRPRFVVLHHTLQPTLGTWHRSSGTERTAQLARFFKERGWKGGPHIFVADDMVWVLTPLTQPGIHTLGWNSEAIGVEMVGDYSRESINEGPGRDTYENAVRVIAALDRALGQPATSLRFHRDAPNSIHKDCPGRLIQKADMVQRIEALLRSKG